MKMEEEILSDNKYQRGQVEMNTSAVSSRQSVVDEKKFVERFWGKFVSIENRDGYQVKRLTVNPGKKISLQKHLHRSEHWVVVSGVARVSLDNDEVVLRRNESVYVGVGAIHRLENIGKIDLEIIEVQVGEYLGEDDVERFDEDFGGVDFDSEDFCIGEGCGEED